MKINTVMVANHKCILVNIVDRMSKFTFINKVHSKLANVVTKTIIDKLQEIKQLITKTILKSLNITLERED